MASLIGIMGEPGSGKSTSLRGLDPSETFYCDCDGKGLNWKGWRGMYNADRKNYIRTSVPQNVIRCMENVAAKAPHIKHFVVDTVNNLMVSDEMRRCREKSYDRWVDLAQCVWDLVDKPGGMRDDLTVILLFHSQTEMNDNGYMFTRIKTNGRKTEKNNIDSKFNWLLQSVKREGKYMFCTTAENSTVRTPLGAFEDDYIPNDITLVLKAMEEY